MSNEASRRVHDFPADECITCPLCGTPAKLLYQQFPTTGEATGARYVAHHPAPIVRDPLHAVAQLIGQIECPASGQIVKVVDAPR